MLTLESAIDFANEERSPARLAFSADGNALVASVGEQVQVWPRWLDKPPRAVATSQSSLERVSITHDGARVFLYRSGNSYTDVLNVATGKITASGLPKQDPSWCSFDAYGSFALVYRGEGNLVRYDYAPGSDKKLFREAWVVERWSSDDVHRRKHVGSHYRFGAVCGPAGVFAALEYKFGGSEPFHGLTVRAVADGSVVYQQPLKADAASKILDAAGLTLAIHPSGRYMAYPDGPIVRLRSLAEGVKVRAKLPPAPRPAPKKKPAKKVAAKTTKKKAKAEPAYRAVAFSPDGKLLAVVGEDALVSFYDTDTWKVTQQFTWNIGKLRAVCFSADGTRAATLSDTGKIMVWDMDV